MTDDERVYALVGCAAGFSFGLIYVATIIRSERKKRDKIVRWMEMTVGCVQHVADSVESVIEDPEKGSADLIDVLHAETAFLNIMLDEYPNPLLEES